MTSLEILTKTLQTTKSDLNPFHTGMGDYESLRACLVAIDTIMKSSQVYPRIDYGMVRKNNFLVINRLWMQGKPDAQHRLRAEIGAEINCAWLLRAIEAVAIEHDLIPIIVDSGSNYELISRATKRNLMQGVGIFDYVRVRHPDSFDALKFLSDKPQMKIIAPKEIIFEWLNINHQLQRQPKRVLLLNRPNNARKH
ncbi:hypothetical protein JA13_212 [Dickeya phage vB_DsoM_JA13]|uniref:Uncharacterized protein n=1 Tax=Dickeya phage vB_DsoM_JA13 TaxID=2283030 RepID=A0A384ZWL3_9CAUD|nr:hypothetical protein JA13_212 [Dickeya phage vB_DsoM_JA13]